jgi:hypothetical protein
MVPRAGSDTEAAGIAGDMPGVFLTVSSPVSFGSSGKRVARQRGARRRTGKPGLASRSSVSFEFARRSEPRPARDRGAAFRFIFQLSCWKPR